MFYVDDPNFPFLLNCKGAVISAKKVTDTNYDLVNATVGYNGVHLMQYTGIRDKNGREIYEGDIVGWKSSSHNKELHGKQVIEWKALAYHEGGMDGYCVMMKVGFVHAFHFAAEGTVEVIGNIYETPELVK